MNDPGKRASDLVDPLLDTVRVHGPCSRVAVAESMGLGDTDLPAFEEALTSAVEQGLLYLTCRDELMTP